MKSIKPSKVFIKPYDKWNHLFIKAGAVILTLGCIAIFYHPFWLVFSTGLSFICLNIGEIIITWLNIRKKRRLSKSKDKSVQD